MRWTSGKVSKDSASFITKVFGFVAEESTDQCPLGSAWHNTFLWLPKGGLNGWALFLAQACRSTVFSARCAHKSHSHQTGSLWKGAYHHHSNSKQKIWKWKISIDLLQCSVRVPNGLWRAVVGLSPVLQECCCCQCCNQSAEMILMV